METFNAKDYEEKLRIDRRLKKEFEKEDRKEERDGCGPILVVFFVIFLFCCMAKCVS